MKTKKSFRDLYSFPGFRARATLKPYPEDPGGYIVTLERRQKKQSVQDAASSYPVSGIDAHTWYETSMPDQPVFTLNSNTGEFPARIVKP